VTERVVAVLARPAPALPPELVAAMLEDVVDLVTDTPMIVPALVVAAGWETAPPAVTWPGTPVAGVTPEPTVGDVFAALDLGEAVAVAVVAADVPDLPTLLLGKLFSALAGPRGAAVAVCPAEGGGLVAVAANLPLVDWLDGLVLRLDDPDGLESLRRTAGRGELSICPGWRRVRALTDVNELDPGLEGWEATRAYLSSPPPPNDAPSLLR
jgi:hypothetical protein